MPTVTPLMKVNRTKSYGAEVILHGDVYDEACAHALELAEKEGYTFSIRLMTWQLQQDRVRSQWKSFRSFHLLIISWFRSVEADLQQVFPHLRNF